MEKLLIKLLQPQLKPLLKLPLPPLKLPIQLLKLLIPLKLPILPLKLLKQLLKLQLLPLKSPLLQLKLPQLQLQPPLQLPSKKQKIRNVKQYMESLVFFLSLIMARNITHVRHMEVSAGVRQRLIMECIFPTNGDIVVKIAKIRLRVNNEN